MKSTYGNRLHQPLGPVKKKLANLVNRTAQRGGLPPCGYTVAASTQTGLRAGLVLITGFQAENTLGRAIVQRQPEVRIFGEPMRLRAEVDSIGELSGHADQRELLEWMEPVVPTLKKVFLVHGEPDARQALKLEIEKMYKLEVVCPKRDERYEV